MNERRLTLGLICVNTVIFLRMQDKTYSNYLSRKYGFIPGFILHGEYYRFLSSQFLHSQPDHFLVYLASSELEVTHGTNKYFWLVGKIFCILGPIHLFLQYIWSKVTNDHSVLYNNHMGISGLIFALNTIPLQSELWTKGAEIELNKSNIWVKLFSSLILMPTSSFSGHLAGILSAIMIGQGGEWIDSIGKKIGEKMNDYYYQILPKLRWSPSTYKNDDNLTEDEKKKERETKRNLVNESLNKGKKPNK